jgi:hypothetical protein
MAVAFILPFSQSKKLPVTELGTYNESSSSTKSACGICASWLFVAIVMAFGSQMAWGQNIGCCKPNTEMMKLIVH